MSMLRIRCLMGELVQAIAITKNAGSHEDVVVAVAKASVLSWLLTRDDPSWDDWLKGLFTKSVRRGAVNKVKELESHAAYFVSNGRFDIAAFKPMLYEDFPAGLLKMRVSDFELQRVGIWARSDSGPTVYVNNEIKMSTGKTAAQVAHGLFGVALKADETRLDEWVSEGLPLTVCDSRISGDLENSDRFVRIEDAGLTEIEPGSITVAVSW